MNANAGDRIVVRGHQVGNPNREGVILNVQGTAGQPPYMVRWSDGREGLFFPGSDASVDRGAASSKRGANKRASVRAQ